MIPCLICKQPIGDSSTSFCDKCYALAECAQIRWEKRKRKNKSTISSVKAIN